MTTLPSDRPRFSKWLVFSAVSLAFFFLNLSTFASLGVVLYGMGSELHWTMTAAGFSFSVLGVACGLSSPLPAACLRWIGGRATLFLGCILLVGGFLLAASVHGIALFYVAMLLLGFGFSMAGNMPGVYLLAEWFETGTSRIIGLYLMFGALGAAFGPLIVEAIVSSAGGWRSNWRWMALAAAVIAAYCLAFVRDAKPRVTSRVTSKVTLSAASAAMEVAANARETVTGAHWSSRDAVFTSQFLLAAASLTLTMTTVTTYSSIVVTHLVNLGAKPAAGAWVLSVIGIAATVVKGAAGRLCESMPSSFVLAVGLGCQAVGSVLLVHAGGTALQLVTAISFGVGWGFAYVAGTVVLLDFFGATTGSKILSIVWLLCTAAAAGPLAAGMVADHFGGFVPILYVFAALLSLLAVPVYLMRAPARDGLPLSQLSPVALQQKA